MFDGIDAGAQRGIDAALAVGVGGDFPAHGVRSLDDGFQLLFGELLLETGRRVRQHAAGGRDLDEVGAFLDLLAHGAPAIIGAVADGRTGEGGHDAGRIAVDVAVTAGDGNRRTGCAQARAGHGAARNGIAQAEDGIIRAADILHGREAGFQRLQRKGRAVEGDVHIRILEFLDPAFRPVLAGDVDMAVDQARQDVSFLEVDDGILLRRGEARRDGNDAAVFDEDRLVGEIALARHREHMARLDDGVLRMRHCGKRGSADQRGSELFHGWFLPRNV